MYLIYLLRPSVIDSKFSFKIKKKKVTCLMEVDRTNYLVRSSKVKVSYYFVI